MEYDVTPEVLAEDARIRALQEVREREVEQEQAERRRQREQTLGIRREAQRLGLWSRKHWTLFSTTTVEKIDALVAQLDPEEHRKRLYKSYNAIMRVYELGLESEDEKIALKCADTLREMLLGRPGQAPPPPDSETNQFMVLSELPTLNAQPTMGEVRAKEEAEQLASAEEEFEEDED